MSNKEVPRELKSTSYEIFILLLSILSLLNIVIFITPGVDPLVKGVLQIMDIFITLIFMVNFVYRFFTAQSKSTYFLREYGWADLLSSLPFQATKVFRVFRVIKIVRISRAYGPGTIARELRDNRAGSALWLTIFLVIVVLEFGGSLIVAVEADDAVPGAPGLAERRPAGARPVHARIRPRGGRPRGAAAMKSAHLCMPHSHSRCSVFGPTPGI